MHDCSPDSVWKVKGITVIFSACRYAVGRLEEVSVTMRNITIASFCRNLYLMLYTRLSHFQNCVNRYICTDYLAFVLRNCYNADERCVSFYGL